MKESSEREGERERVRERARARRNMSAQVSRSTCPMFKSQAKSNKLHSQRLEESRVGGGSAETGQKGAPLRGAFNTSDKHARLLAHFKLRSRPNVWPLSVLNNRPQYGASPTPAKDTQNP